MGAPPGPGRGAGASERFVRAFDLLNDEQPGDGAPVFRGLTFLEGWSGRDNIDWQFDLPSDNEMGHKHLVGAADLAVSVADR